jgi:hypothetical protein
MKLRILVAGLALVLSSAVAAKLPPAPPVDPEKAAAAAEAKAKSDAAIKTQQAAAEDRVAARYIKEQKAKGKDVKPQMAATSVAAVAKPAKPVKK